MRPAHLYFGEDVLIPRWFPPRVHVVHDPVDLEIGDHFFDIVGHNQRVRLSRRLKDVCTGHRFPVVLEIPPSAFQYEAMNRLRMAMAR